MSCNTATGHMLTRTQAGGVLVAVAGCEVVVAPVARLHLAVVAALLVHEDDVAWHGSHWSGTQGWHCFAQAAQLGRHQAAVARVQTARFEVAARTAHAVHSILISPLVFVVLSEALLRLSATCSADRQMRQQPHRR